MFENFILLTGLSVAGITVGYLTGASSSPVVSVVIPLLFGLAATGFALLQPHKGLNNIPEQKKNDEKWIKSFMEGIELGQKKTKKLIGMALICFSIFYIIGTAIGAKARIDHWFSKKQTKAIPWNNSTRPKTVNEALSWILIKEKLTTLGYTENLIDELYSIRTNETGQRQKINAKQLKDFFDNMNQRDRYILKHNSNTQDPENIFMYKKNNPFEINSNLNFLFNDSNTIEPDSILMDKGQSNQWDLSIEK